MSDAKRKYNKAINAMSNTFIAFNKGTKWLSWINLIRNTWQQSFYDHFKCIFQSNDNFTNGNVERKGKDGH